MAGVPDGYTRVLLNEEGQEVRRHLVAVWFIAPNGVWHEEAVVFPSGGPELQGRYEFERRDGTVVYFRRVSRGVRRQTSQAA